MRNILKILSIISILVLPAFSHSCHTVKNSSSEPEEKSVSISGVAVYTTSYCGGTRPPKYILEQHNKKRQLADTQIKLTGTNSKVFTINTNDSGYFEVQLPKNQYQYFLTPGVRDTNDEIKGLTSPTGKLFDTSFGNIEIIGDTAGLELLFHIPCKKESILRP
ncbi:MAG: hypothetical protein U9N85_10745 [Bacteroidota bacterium]|nr:hypothetical protein [Bacteroidota bacterium]